MKSSCDSSPLLGVQHVPAFPSVISASGGSPLPLADGHPLILSCGTRSHQMLRYSDCCRPGQITCTYARVQWGMRWLYCLQGERLSWGYWCYCLQPSMLNCFSPASPSYEQSGAVSSQGATQTLPALRPCKHQKALLGAAHWVLFKCCLANNK